MPDPADQTEGAGEFSPEIVRYVAGEALPIEAAELERRMLVDPLLADQIESLRQVWAATGQPTKPRELDRAWQKVRAQLDDADDRQPAARSAKRFGTAFGRIGRPSRTAAVAAAIVALALPAGLVWWVEGARPAPAASAGDVPVREYATLTGERAELQLHDGTRVILGAASRLTVPGNFRSIRNVTLDGQAHFDVVHDASRPFRVRTSLGVAEDLGTAFVVTTYPEAGGMQVVVASGEVAIAAATTPEKVVLRAGDVGRLDSAGVGRVERGVDLEAHLAWTRGELVFRRTPLRQVLPQLERWYGIRVRLASPALAPVPVSASFAAHAPSGAVALIAAAVGAVVTRDPSDDAAFTLHSR